MKSIYIERHNEATRLILAEVIKGKAGNCIVCADVGSHDKIEHLSIQNTRIPSSIISDQTLQEAGLADADRDRLRPDALIIEGLIQSDLCGTASLGKVRKRNARGQPKALIDRQLYDREADPPFRSRKAYLIEVGYGTEIRYATKMQEKQDQHSRLNNLLQVEGFQGVLNPIILGTSGGIFINQDKLLAELGVSQERLRKLNVKLHAHAIHSMDSLIKLRRLKEAELQHRHVHRKKRPPDK